MGKKKGNLNIFVIVVFAAVIVCNSVNILVQLQTLSRPEDSFEFAGMTLTVNDHTVATYNAILSILIITSLALVLNKKLIGAYLFFALQLANFIGLSAVEGENFDVTTRFLLALVMSGIFAGLLFLRSDGESGWNILKGKEQTMNDEQTKNEEDKNV